MKLLKISIIRALAAIVVGVLLLKYDEAVLKGLTIAMGVMFLIAGVVSLIGWINSRRKKADFKVYDNGKEVTDDDVPMFPIAGLGSLLLGLILSLTQTADFLSWAMYLLGALLVLGSLNILMNLVSARKMEPVPTWMWVPPVLVAGVSIFAMFKGLFPSEVTTTILGVTALVYAVVEVVFSFLLTAVKRRYDTTQAQVRRATRASDIEDAEVVTPLSTRQ